MNIVAHNLQAMNTMRQYNIILNRKSKSAERLASGYRINRSADDAAGLAISEKMRLQIRGLHQASRNIQDGMSVCQVADGALQEVQDMLHRMNELAIQASNDTNTSKDRQAINQEIEQLKQGMKDIFSDTSFNTMKLFRAPNVPEVTGQPNDMQVFNTGFGSDGRITYGGVSIGNIRYTWQEMGVGLESDGRTFTGGKYEFETWDGEKVTIETQAGTQTPKVSRNYTWSADTTGIYVNKKLAATWGSMGIDPANPNPGTYDFNYHGMTIDFQIPDNLLDMDELIDQINGDNLNNVSWNSYSSYTTGSSAVNILSNSSILITNANKNKVIDSSNPYAISADATGITLTDMHSGSHTVTNWEQFHDVSGSAGADSNGGYPIVDWGLDNDNNEQTDITFDDTAVYQYTDQALNFSFDFKLADEASLQAVENGLNHAQLSAEILNRSATTVVTGSDADGKFSIEVNATKISFETQKTLNRDFDDPDYTYGTDLSVSYDGTNGVYTFGYVISNGAGGTGQQTLSCEMTESNLRSWMQSGGKRVLNFVSSDMFARDSMMLSIEVNALSSTHSIGTAGYENDLNTYINSFMDFVNNTAELSTQETGYLTQDISINNSTVNNINAHTAFGVKMNPPEKRMQIQASDRPYSSIDMRWDCLSVGILGLSGANTETYESSQAAIGEIEKALNIISKNRATFGAYQNRMEHAKANVNNMEENIQAAESAIRDSDMAGDMVQYARDSIIAQVGEAILAQEKQNAQGILRLLE